MIKIVMEHTKAVNKEGKDINKLMNKNEIDIDDFTTKFSKIR